MFLNSSLLVFLTIPFFVANNKYLSSSFASIAINVAIFSFGANWSKLTIAVPLDCLLPSGISNASSLNTLPLLVKNNNLLWVVVVTSSFMKSSSLVVRAATPLPPLFWLL